MNDKLEAATTQDKWGFCSWSKGVHNYPTPAILHGPDQPPAITHAEKCYTICNELFQRPPPLPTTYNINLTTHNPNELPFEQITVTEVKEALFGASAKAAPGHSQIPYKVLRWAWSSVADYITALMQKCLQNRYHPKTWCWAIAIALRKPRKPDYSNPQVYCLIQLLEYLGKVLESIVTSHLSYLVGRHNLVPGNQFGGCSHSSTMDAILAFTNNI